MVGSTRRWFLVDLAICAAMLAYMLPATLSSDEIGAGTVWDSILLPAVILPVLVRRRDAFAASPPSTSSAWPRRSRPGC
jgi:hypothetical protein